MAWRDEMRPASFRGVPFYVTKSDGQIGRRNVVNEYPNRDEAYVEDLGLKVSSFTLDCFVLGENHFAARDNLEAAFKKAGPGELVHPWRGRMNVSVTDCRPSESIDQLGRQSWSVTFTQTGENKQPNVRPDTLAKVDAAADDAILAVQEDFADMFSVENMPEFVEADALTQINTALDTVLAAGRAMLPDMTVLPAFISNASGILSKASQLMRLPTNLASELTAQIAALFGLSQSPISAFNALKALFGFSHQSSTRTTAARRQLDDNRAAVTNLTRRTAIIEAARSSANINFESRQQALQARDAVVNAIETEQLTAGDNVFNTLADLRAAVVADVSARAADLPELITYTPKATLPAVILAYSLYGDARKDADVIARNNIAHPGFVRGGQPLEILSDG
jgi:prophage DNA circulation protein